MTPFEWATLVYGVLGAAASLVGYLAWQRVQDIKKSADTANTELQALKDHMTADAAVLSRELADFKLEVAKQHPTFEHLTRAIDDNARLVAAMFTKLDKIQEDLNAMFGDLRVQLAGKEDRKKS